MISIARLFVLLALATVAYGREPAPCKRCVAWNETQKPFQIYGNTYYVGVRGLTSVLIVSDAGNVLIDGDLQESAPKIAASIRQLGFRVEDVKLILNTHVHFDHAGGIAELQQLSGATVAASEASAKVLKRGRLGPDDPQYPSSRGTPPIASVRIVKDGETLRVGSLELTAHLTPGHTPGGTTWTWKSCESQRCLNVVYADSVAPVAADNFRFTHNSTYPNVLDDFARSFAVLDHLPCDILVTNHPDASDLITRLEKHSFIDPTACHRLADHEREQLAKRIASESR